MIKGQIGNLGLTDWWLTQFTKKEKEIIIETYQPMGLGNSRDLLLNYDILDQTESATKFLTNLSGWFNTKENRYLAYKMIKKAEELIDLNTDIIDIHFFYQHKIQIYYKDRDNNSQAYDIAKNACLEQIKIAPKVTEAFKTEYNDNFLPSHVGYTQLAIIEEKEKNWKTVIDIAEKAKKEGWNGDWDKRIERCKKKIGV